MQLLLHENQLRALVLTELEHWDSGGLREHLSNQSLVNDAWLIDIALAELLFHADFLSGELLFFITLGSRSLKVLVCNRLLLGSLDHGNLLFHFLQLWRSREEAQTHASACLINKVNCLVWQEAVGYVAIAHAHGCNDCTIGDRHLVVCLVAIAKALQDVDCHRWVWLRNLNRLEPAH